MKRSSGCWAFWFVLTSFLAPAFAEEPEILRAPDAVSSQIIELENFKGGKSLKALGWEGGNLDDDKVDHFLMTEAGKSFIRSSYIPGTEAKYLFKEVDWDSEKFPYLRWQWRTRKFPKGAKILNPKLSDASAQIYVLWRFFPRYFVLKYFWANDEPVGSTFKDGNVFLGFLFGRILRSGPSPTPNEWKTETRNIAADFLEAFKQKPPGKVRGIAVLSDGDETKSPSEADFTDFQALKKP